MKTKIYLLTAVTLFLLTFIGIAATKQVKPDQGEEGVEELKSFDIQYSPYNREKTEVHGLKLGLPMSAGRGMVDGAEISLMSSDTANISGFQGALLGVDMTRKLDGAQVALLANMIRDGGDGFQLGILNFAAKSITGAQFGLFNYSKRTKGVQAGIVNNADEMADFQLGILNYNKRAWIPLLPLMNFSPRVVKYFYASEEE